MTAASAFLRLSVSTEESVSLSVQRDAVKALAVMRGLTLDDEHIYEEDGTSGSVSSSSKGWARWIADARERGHVLLAYDWSRITREGAATSLLLLAEVDQAGSYLLTADGFDSRAEASDILAALNGWNAKRERAATVKRVTAAHERLRHEGRASGGRVPFGWRNVPNPDGPGYVRALDPETAPIVREAVDRVLAGEGVATIADDFTRRGLPAPEGTNGKTRRPGWAHDTLGALLRRPILAGYTIHRGRPVLDRDGRPLVNPLAALVTEEERDRLMRALRARTVRQTRHDFGASLLHGLAVCGTCGERLHRRAPVSRTPDGWDARTMGPAPLWRYACQHGGCSAPAGASMADLEDLVVSTVLRDYGHERVMVEVAVGMTPEEQRERLAAVTADLTDAQADLAAAAADPARAPELAEIAARLAALREEEARVREARTGETEVVDAGFDVAEMLSDFLAVYDEPVMLAVPTGTPGLERLAAHPTDRRVRVADVDSARRALRRIVSRVEVDPAGRRRSQPLADRVRIVPVESVGGAA